MKCPVHSLAVNSGSITACSEGMVYESCLALGVGERTQNRHQGLAHAARLRQSRALAPGPVAWLKESRKPFRIIKKIRIAGNLWKFISRAGLRTDASGTRTRPLLPDGSANSGRPP